MREAPPSGRSGVRSRPGGWLSPVLYLAATLVLLALSWQGFFFNRATAPWIAGGVLAILGLWWGFRHRGRRSRAVLFLVGALCAALAPVAQGGRQLLENGRIEQAALAELAGYAAPALSYAEVLGEEGAGPLYGDDLVVLNFWATWCPPCLQEMPALQAFAEEHAGEPVRVVGLTVFYGDRDHDREQMLRLRAERGVLYPTYVAEDRTNLEAFRVRSLPTTILIDAGTLVEYGIGIRGTQRVLAEAEQRLEARRAGRA